MKRYTFLNMAAPQSAGFSFTIRVQKSMLAGLLAGSLLMPFAFAQSDHTGRASLGEVRVYNWSDYIDPDKLTEFTEMTGIRVIYDTFDSNEMLLAKTLTGNGQYDLIVPSAFTVSYLIQADKLEKIDRSQLKNLDNIAPFVNERLEDLPGVVDYSVGYMWGSTGLAYNVKAVEARLPKADHGSMSLLFDPENAKALSSCGIYLLDTPTELFPMALTYLGLDPNSTHKADLDKAEALLKSIRPYVKKFHSSEYVNAIANGDACLVLGWSGDLYLAKSRAKEADNGVEIRYIIPKEGGLVGFDQLAILKDSPNKVNAYKLIDFLIDGKHNADITNYLDYATSNQAAMKYLKEELREDTALYPPKSEIDRLRIIKPMTQKEQKNLMKRWLSIVNSK